MSEKIFWPEHLFLFVCWLELNYSDIWFFPDIQYVLAPLCISLTWLAGTLGAFVQTP